MDFSCRSFLLVTLDLVLMEGQTSSELLPLSEAPLTYIP
jgi:hypothetical protein